MARVFRKNLRKRTASRRKTARRNRFTSNRYRLGRARRFARLYRNPLSSMRTNAVLHYNTVISLNPKPDQLGSTGSNTWQFCANSLYDPDQTGTGHQPLYFDNFMSVFEKYRVNFCQITVTVINHKVNAVTEGTGFTEFPNYAYKLFILSDASSGTAEFPGYMNIMTEEAGPQLKWRFISPSLVGKLPKLKSSVSPHQLARKPFRDDSLEGTSSSGPFQPAWFYVGITSADGVTDPPSVYLNVHLKFFAEFFDRKNLQTEN